MFAGVRGAFRERFVSQVAWSTPTCWSRCPAGVVGATGFRPSVTLEMRAANLVIVRSSRVAEAAVPVAAGLGAAVGSRTQGRLGEAEHPGVFGRVEA